MSSTEKESELDLECSLCKDVFREPKTLGCLHSFCLECLETHYEKTHSNVELKCPLCRTPFQSQSRDQLSNLSTDSFLLNSLNIYNSLKNSIPQQNQKVICSDGENEAAYYCLDCEIYFCEMCSKPHQKSKATKNHSLISIEEMKNQFQVNSISNSQVYCQIHERKEFELFCEDCKEPICSFCVLQHQSHKFSAILDVLGNEKQLLIDLINQVKPKEKELREGINKCEEVIKQLEINSTTTQTQINQLFNKIRIKLDEKEQELLNELDEIEKHRKKELEIQKEDLKFGIESIIGSCQMIQNSISLLKSNKNDARLLSMKKLYESRLNYLSNNTWKIEPCHNPFISFFLSEKEQTIYSNISKIGMIDSNEVLADKCLISYSIETIFKGEEFTYEIMSYSKEGNQIKNGGNEKRFEIKIEEESKSEKNEENEWNEWKIVDLNNGKYEVKIKLKDIGNYLIFVQFDGINIKPSPFQVQVFPNPKQRNYDEINEPKLIFGSKGSENSQFISPQGITFNSKGNILVNDFGNHRIQIFSSEGKFISTFGSKGNGNGQFQNPFATIINQKGNIFVSETGNHRIQIFDSEGKFISTFGSIGNLNGQLNGPYGITTDLNENILVCEWKNHRVQIFDPKGNFLLTFGEKGYGNGQFHCPLGIAINSKGNIIVSDNGNHRIQIFDSEGKFISTFGSKGNRNGQFDYPCGICVDSNDNILICDHDNNRIQIFNSEGKFISVFGVNQPTYVAIHPKTQHIFVCGSDHKLSIF